MLGPSRAEAEVIDRLLAVVDGQVITLSDVQGGTTLGLVEAGPAADPVGAVLDRLIERALMLAEVDRYQPPEPAEDQVAARLAGVRRRFPSETALKAALDASAFTEARLAEFVRNDLRIERYLEQRFPATAQPSDDEVTEYYRTRASEFASGGAVPPLEQVRPQVRQRLAAERRAALVADWVGGLRRRANIVRLYPK
jgi:hypothetical protein